MTWRKRRISTKKASKKCGKKWGLVMLFVMLCVISGAFFNVANDLSVAWWICITQVCKKTAVHLFSPTLSNANAMLFAPDTWVPRFVARKPKSLLKSFKTTKQQRLKNQQTPQKKKTLQPSGTNFHQKKNLLEFSKAFHSENAVFLHGPNEGRWSRSMIPPGTTVVVERLSEHHGSL